MLSRKDSSTVLTLVHHFHWTRQSGTILGLDNFGDGSGGEKR